MRGIDGNTAGTANIAKAPQQVLTDYIKGKKNLSQNLSQNKQEIINAIHDFNLTSADAERILAKLSELDGQGQNQTSSIGASEDDDIKLITDVLNKLKNDHRSYFHSGSTEAYKVVIEGLKNISGRSESIAQRRGHGAFGVSAKSYLFAAESSKFDTNSLSSAIKARASLRKANLRGVQLGKLSAKELVKIDVKGAKLDKVSFESFYRAGVRNFSGCDLSGQDLQDVNFADTTLSETTFTNVKLNAKSFNSLHGAGVKDFSGVETLEYNDTNLAPDLDGVKLNVTCFNALYNARVRDFRGCDLSGQNFSDVVFTDTDLQDVNFAGTTLSETTFTNVKLNAKSFDSLHGAGVKDFSGVETLEYNDTNLAPDLDGVKLNVTCFNALYNAGVRDFHGCDLSGQDFSDVDFTGTTLSETTFTNVKLNAKSFDSLLGAGVKDFSGVETLKYNNANPAPNLVGVKLNGKCFKALCKAEVRNFRGCDLSNSEIITYETYHEVDFTNANLTNVTFKNLELRNVNFTDATLSGSEFNNVKLSGANFDMENSSLNQPNTKLQFTNVELDVNSFITLFRLGVTDFAGCKLTASQETTPQLNKLELEQLNAISFKGMFFDFAPFRTLLGLGVTNFSDCSIRFENIEIEANMLLQLNGSSLTRVCVEAAKLDQASLGVLLKAGVSKFENCDLSNLAIDLNTENIIFSNLRLINTTFINYSENNKIELNQVRLNAKSFESLLYAGVKDFSYVAELMCDSENKPFAGISKTLLNGITLNMKCFNALSREAKVEEFTGCNFNLRGQKDEIKFSVVAGYKMDLSNTHFSNGELSGWLGNVNLSRASFKDITLNEIALTGVNLSEASFENVDLCNTDFTGVNLSEASFKNVNLSKIIFKQTNFSEAKFDGCTIGENLFDVIPEGQLLTCKLSFNGGLNSKLKMIDQNSDVSVREYFMEQAFEYLKDKDINPVLDTLRQILFSSRDRDYSSVLKGCPDFLNKLLSNLINSQTTPVIKENELRQVLDIIAKLTKDEKKTFMLRNNNCFNLLIHRGRTSTQPEVQTLVEKLWQKYFKYFPQIKNAYSIANTIYSFENHNESLIFMSESNVPGENHQQFLVVPNDYVNKFLYSNNNSQGLMWYSFVFISKNKYQATAQPEDVFKIFTLFSDKYSKYLMKNGVLKLLALLNLKEYHQHFVNALGGGRGNTKFTDITSQGELAKIFNPFLNFPATGSRTDMALKEEHIQQVFDTYCMNNQNNTQKAKLLLILAGVFMKYSSVTIFGDNSNSPEILRYYAYGLMKAAYGLYKNIFYGIGYDGLVEHILGDSCTQVLSDNIIRHCRNFRDYSTNFAGIIPEGW